MHVNTDDVDRYVSIKDVPIARWEPGEWHHAVVTWDPAYVRIYLDGEMVSEASMPSPIDDLGEGIFIGKDLATPQFAVGETAIDELRIYPRPLFPEEVRRACQRAENPEITQRPYADLSIYYTGFASEDRAELSFVATETVPEDGSATLTIRHPETGAAPIKRDLSANEAGTLEDVEIDTSALTLANWDVIVRIADTDGNALLEKTKKLWIRDKFWKRDPAGVPTEVPEPWEPVEVGGLTVKTWNRAYRLGRGMIQSMTTEGEQVLARPAGFYATSGGTELRHAKDWTPVEETALRAVFESELALGNARIPQRLTIEFDGFMRLDATVPAGTTMDLLRFEMPMREQFAEYLHATAHKEKYYTAGSFEAGEWPAANVYNFWMGTEDFGVDVMYEGCVGWPSEADENHVAATKADGEAVFTAHIARGQTTLREPLELSFGIQATPVRPMPEGWRADWRVAPRVGVNPDPQDAEEFGANYAIIWWSDEPTTPRWFGFPQPSDPEAFQALVDDFHARGIKVLVYDTLTSASPNTPEAVEYSGEWFRRPTPGALRDPGEEPPPERWLRVDQTHPDWADFIVGYQARVMEQYGIDGWYFDCAQPYQMQDGVFPVFEYREAAKRAYVAVKNHDPDGQVITHMSAHYITPALSFTDAMLPGEQFRWPLPEWEVRNDYTEVLSLDYARTELMGKNLGCVPVFLPEFGGRSGGERNERNSWHLLAMTRLHDTNVWPIWTAREPFRQMWRAQDRFGIGEADVEFLGYWSAELAEVDAEEVRVSAYTRPGKALVVVSNFLGHEDRTVAVRPNLGLLGFERGVTAQDLL
ncbi:MAG: glycoside hydrolase domain-containing protein, partial [Armatimonadota bacterium]